MTSDLPSGGSVHALTRWGDPTLHTPCPRVVDFDAALGELAADMVATMSAADGVGLAANQIGVSLRVLVFDCIDGEGESRVSGVVCNPTLSLPHGKDRSLDESDEGCLSLPGAFIPCARPDRALVEGYDLTGRPVSFEGTGLLARCLQHETDHLDGIVFADRLSRRNRKRLFNEAARVADDFPSGWPLGT